MTTIEELNHLDDFDELQKQLIDINIIEQTEQFLESNNIQKQFAKQYLSSKLFYKFKNDFPYISEEFSEYIDKIYNNIDLENNLSKYVDLLNQWKTQDINKTIDELSEMKQKTRNSSNETDNKDCKNGFQHQENILNIAEDYYKSFQ